MNVKGTERSGKQWNQKTDYKQITCLGTTALVHL